MQPIIHKSPVLLAFKIIVLEILIELLYLVVSFLIQQVSLQVGYEVPLVSPITQALLLPIQISILVWMLVRWSSETYEIQADELIVRSGIIKRTERAYPYRNMQSVIVQQSIIERIVDAGTVSVFVPTLGTELVFTEVPRPKHFAETIKKVIPEEGNSQFILRR